MKRDGDGQDEGLRMSIESQRRIAPLLDCLDGRVIEQPGRLQDPYGGHASSLVDGRLENHHALDLRGLRQRGVHGLDARD